MGMECPYGCGRQRVATYLTSDGSNPKKMSEVIAFRLTCNHVVGGEDYEAFRKVATQADAERAEAIRAIEEEARQKKATAYQTFVMKRQGGKHAE